MQDVHSVDIRLEMQPSGQACKGATIVIPRRYLLRSIQMWIVFSTRARRAGKFVRCGLELERTREAISVMIVGKDGQDGLIREFLNSIGSSARNGAHVSNLLDCLS